MNYIVTRPLFFYQVLERRDTRIKDWYGQQSPAMQRAIHAVCLNLKDHFGLMFVPTAHHGYYQSVTLDVQCILNDEPILIGQLKRGSILELFQAEAESDFGFGVLERLKEDFRQVTRPATQYQNLELVVRDTCITLNLSTQEYEVTQQNGNVTRTEVYEFDQHFETFEELLEQYHRVLLLIQK